MPLCVALPRQRRQPRSLRTAAAEEAFWLRPSGSRWATLRQSSQSSEVLGARYEWTQESGLSAMNMMWSGVPACKKGRGWVGRAFCVGDTGSGWAWQYSRFSLAHAAFGTAWVSCLLFKTERNSRDKPRDVRMKQVGATYVCNTGGWRDTATYPYLEPQPYVPWLLSSVV